MDCAGSPYDEWQENLHAVCKFSGECASHAALGVSLQPESALHSVVSSLGVGDSVCFSSISFYLWGPLALAEDGVAAGPSGAATLVPFLHLACDLVGWLPSCAGPPHFLSSVAFL